MVLAFFGIAITNAAYVLILNAIFKNAIAGVVSEFLRPQFGLRF